MEKKHYKKICGQVNTPQVDNSHDECEDFVNSSCVLVNRKSAYVNNVPGEYLNDYLKMLEDKLLKQQNMISLLVKKIDALSECCNSSSGIGTFDL
jgi:hypothetical protein